MTLAESILSLLNETQSRTETTFAEAKADYESAKKEYDAAFEAQFADNSENHDELAIAAACAKGTLEAYKSSYDYCAGKKVAVDLLSLFIRTAIESHETVYGKSVPAGSADFFDEVTA